MLPFRVPFIFFDQITFEHGVIKMAYDKTY